MHTLLQSPIQPDFDTATDIKRLTECDFAFPGSDRHIHATAEYCESRSVCEENEVNVTVHRYNSLCLMLPQVYTQFI